MGEVVNFPKAKRPIPGGAEDPRLLTHVSALPSDLRAVERAPLAQPVRRPSSGVFDNPDGDTPDAA